MTQNWKDVVTDPTERKLLEALQNPDWDFRTIRGLANALALPQEEVARILDRFRSLGFVRESPLPGNDGERLFTLASKSVSLKESLNIVRASVTKTLK
jgi:hypothetical protein